MRCHSHWSRSLVALFLRQGADEDHWPPLERLELIAVLPYDSWDSPAAPSGRVA
jgi:hypothetical protein